MSPLLLELLNAFTAISAAIWLVAPMARRRDLMPFTIPTGLQKPVPGHFDISELTTGQGRCLTCPLPHANGI